LIPQDKIIWEAFYGDGSKENRLQEALVKEQGAALRDLERRLRDAELRGFELSSALDKTEKSRDSAREARRRALASQQDELGLLEGKMDDARARALTYQDRLEHSLQLNRDLTAELLASKAGCSLVLSATSALAGGESS
jgi:hypothetical protein